MQDRQPLDLAQRPGCWSPSCTRFACPWSEVQGFEVRREYHSAPRAGSWVEVSAVMCLKNREDVELTALGCFHERWKKSVRVIEAHVGTLNELLHRAG